MALPNNLPGFVTAESGTIVLPASCDVDGRPSVVTLTSSPAEASSPARTSRLLLEVAARATRATGCAPPPRTRTAPDRQAPHQDPAPCAIPGLPTLPGSTSTTAPDFRTCAIPGARDSADTPGAAAEATRTAAAPRTPAETTRTASKAETWAARFTATARPRVVALFDGLTGDRPPAPGWRARGSIDADGALVRADCARGPAVFVMRAGPGRTGTRLDDPRAAFPAFVAAAAPEAGCAPLRSA